MDHCFRQRRTIEFAETDMAGIVHFSNFFRYMEACEHAFFRSLGLAVHRREGEVMTGFARVHAECKYLAPLQYQDEIEVRLEVREKRASTLSYDFLFVRPRGAGEEEVCAKGALTVVCVRGRPGVDPLRAAPLPEDVRQAIGPAAEAHEHERTN